MGSFVIGVRKEVDWLGKNGRSRTLKNAKLADQEHNIALVVCVQEKAKTLLDSFQNMIEQHQQLVNIFGTI